jgi:serine/threonine-protein kinase
LQHLLACDDRNQHGVIEGRWQLAWKLAEHPSESVWRAFDLIEGGPVLLRAATDDRSTGARPNDVLHLRVLRSSPHPNLETPIAWRERGVVDYVVMPWLTGEQLSDVVGTHWSLPDDRTLAILVDAAKGLGALHRLHLTHRNVCPERLWLVGANGDSVRVTGAVRFPCGTATQPAMYRAPEQVVGDPITSATDVYALGVIAYRLLSGSHFAVASGLTPELAHVCAVSTSLAGQVDARLAALVSWMLRKAPEHRPTMAQVVAAADAISSDLPIELPHAPTREAYEPRSREAVDRLNELFARSTLAEPRDAVA